MTREAALAVIWTGLQVLAMNGQLVTFNDLARDRAWFGIANTKLVVEVLATGKKRARLADLEKEPKIANTSKSVGDEEK
jgi:hypothetical protein